MVEDAPGQPDAGSGGQDLAALDPADPLSAGFRAAVSEELEGFVDAHADAVAEMGSELEPVLDLVRQSLAGGKRLRPAFGFWSYRAAGGSDACLPDVLRAAASLELLHVSALVHDDVMDSSDLRRGRPAAHRRFEALHADGRWLGDRTAFGRAGAILLGDLLLMWSAEMVRTAGLAAVSLARALPLLDAMRTEVTCGQYLDVVAQAQPLVGADGAAGTARSIGTALDEASRVVEFKSARYTVQRPCQIGAALADGGPESQETLAAYGSPLGRAFQFRDDLLGVFGDPQRTGKPAGDDLREGKRTVLVAHAYAGTDAEGRRLLARRLGDPTLDERGVSELQALITASGAREAVEEMIAEGHRQAVRALADADLTDEGRTALTALADLAVRRES